MSVKTPLEHLSHEVRNIYLSQNIKSVSELYGQRLYIMKSCVPYISLVLLTVQLLQAGDV
jgi:hypothetical protein